MKTQKIYYIILFITIFNSLLPVRTSANQFFQFETDYAVFRGTDNKSILEIYYSFFQKGLLYKYDNGEYKADGYLEISILQKEDDKVIMSKQFKVPSALKDTSNNSLNKNFVGQLNFFLISGKEYTLKIIGSDFSDPSSSDTVIREIKVNIPTDGFEVSDLQLSSNIEKSTNKDNLFYKNTLEILPNPQNLFGNNLDKLFYYCEIYGLNDSSGSTRFSVDEIIMNLNNDTLFELKKDHQAHGKSVVEYNNISVSNLPSGVYYLKIMVTDLKNNLNEEREKKFLIYNNNVSSSQKGETDDGYLKSEYANMKPELVEKDFELTLYIRTKSETESFNSLTDLNDKRKFMYEFWKSRDNNSLTPQNEYKINYLKKIVEANNMYKENFKEGWRTDRGRIYIIYGKPDEVDRHPFEAGTNSYEQWTYYSSAGGGICIFVERDPSIGAYYLTHSTFRGETHNDNWQRELVH